VGRKQQVFVMENPNQVTKRIPSSERCRIAHDFNNDLTIILRRCDLLLDLLGSNGEAGKHLRLIQQAADNMTSRIIDTCELARGGFQLWPALDVPGFGLCGCPPAGNTEGGKTPRDNREDKMRIEK
jgi:hypothetical protein